MQQMCYLMNKMSHNRHRSACLVTGLTACGFSTVPVSRFNSARFRRQNRLFWKAKLPVLQYAGYQLVMRSAMAHSLGRCPKYSLKHFAK